MNYNEIVASVAKKNGLTRQLVDRTYKAYWRVINEYISNIPLKQSETEEDFLKLRPNVNIPSIGKLYVSLGKFKRQKRLYKEQICKNHVED